MCEYTGVDISLKETAISVRRDGQRVWRGKCSSDPCAITEVLRRHADPDTGCGAHPAGPNRDRAFQPDPWSDEDLRTGCPAPKGGRFEEEVRRLLSGQEDLARILLLVLEAWRSIRARATELTRQVLATARQSDACRLLMSVPGIGAITATAFVTAIEDPENFRKSRSVGAWLGLTTRRY